MATPIQPYKFSIVDEFAGKVRTGNHAVRQGMYMGLPKCIELSAEMEYHGVEHAPFTAERRVEEFDTSFFAAVRSAQERSGIGVSGIHWAYSFWDLIDEKYKGMSIFAEGDKKVETQQFTLFLLDYVRALGGAYMVHGSPASRKRPDTIQYGDAFDIVKKFYTEVIHTTEGDMSLLDYAEKRRVKIAFEPLGTNETNFLNFLGEGLLLVHHIDHPFFCINPDVKALAKEVADAKQISVSEVKPGDITEVIMQFWQHASHYGNVHLNAPSMCGPTMDDFNLEPIVRAFHVIGYTGGMSVEPFKLAEESHTYQSEARDIIRNLTDLDARVLKYLNGE